MVWIDSGCYVRKWPRFESRVPGRLVRGECDVHVGGADSLDQGDGPGAYWLPLLPFSPLGPAGPGTSLPVSRRDEGTGRGSRVPSPRGREARLGPALRGG